MTGEIASGEEHLNGFIRSVKTVLYRHNFQKLSCIELWFRAGEMAQRLRTLTALPEVLSSNPSNHMVAHNHL